MDLPAPFDFGASMNSPINTQGRIVIRTLPKNPMDRCTIVSVYPREIVYDNPTVFPRRHVIPAGSADDFSILVIESGSFFIASQIEKQPPTEVQVNSAQLVESIIKDSVPTMSLASVSSSPGVFWCYGQYDKKSIYHYIEPVTLKKFEQLLNEARARQLNYWKDIVDDADYLWSASSGNPHAISDDARLAAKVLGLEKSKPWMANTIATELAPCPACGEMVNHMYAICKYCHNIINIEKAKNLNINQPVSGFSLK